MSDVNRLFCVDVSCYNIHYFLFISSPFLFVIGDDRVILYTEVDDTTSDAADA